MFCALFCIAIILELVSYMCIICDVNCDIGIGHWFI